MQEEEEIISFVPDCINMEPVAFLWKNEYGNNCRWLLYVTWILPTYLYSINSMIIRIVWASRKSYKPGKILNEAEKQRGFIEKLHHYPCFVCISAISDSL